MRTDGLQLAREAVDQTPPRHDPRHLWWPLCARTAAALPVQPRKNAQEAHEAIRPTDPARRPEDLARFLDRDQLAALRADLEAHGRLPDGERGSSTRWRSTSPARVRRAAPCFGRRGSIVRFDGFLKVYEEGRDDVGEEDGRDRRLPAVAEGQGVDRGNDRGRPALHPAAAALFRGQPGQEAGGAGHRPALDLRLDSAGAAGPRVCPPGEAPVPSRGPGPAGHQLPDPTSSAGTSSTTSPPSWRRSSDDISGGRADWKEVLRQFWASFAGAVEEDQGPDDHPGDRRPGRGSRGPISSARAGTGKTRARCPRCGSGRARAEAGQAVGRVHRLLETTRNAPIPARWRCRPTMRRRRPEACPAPQPGRGSAERAAGHGAQGPVRHLCPAPAKAATARSPSGVSLPKGVRSARHRAGHRARPAVAAPGRHGVRRARKSRPA